MDIYEHVSCLKKANYSKFLYFTKNKYPRFSNVFQRFFPDRSSFFQVRLSRPLMVICETVNICSNDCIICPYSKMTRKKEIMPLGLFEKVVSDYSDMGGGKLSLTPKVGDIFFDEFLLERLELIKKYPKITGISVTTNTIMADRFTDDELEIIVNSFERIHISIYGINEEEYEQMTRRKTYTRMVQNIRRILKLTKKPESVFFGFRLLSAHSQPVIEQWITENFNRNILYGQTNTYMDWCGSVEKQKPVHFKGEWVKRPNTTSQCIIPLVACQIFSNGGVSFCSCNDFDMKEEFLLGNLSEQSLTHIYNSSKNKGLWKSPEEIPKSCKNCISYRPFSNMEKYEYMFEKPVDFIGG
jgi:radical SAM protein with 4Fe4S-binding SPASM domain